VNLAQLEDYRKATQRRRILRPRASAWSLPPGVRNTTVAALVGCQPATVRNWRTGRCRPQPRHERRLALLRALLRQARD
jgi:hypothetical protein